VHEGFYVTRPKKNCIESNTKTRTQGTMAIISECIVIPDVFYDQQNAEKEDRKAILTGI
jgi:hypothetical protein